MSARATLKLVLSVPMVEAVARIPRAPLVICRGCAPNCVRFSLVPLTVAAALVNATVPKESKGLNVPLPLLTISSTHSAEESEELYETVRL